MAMHWEPMKPRRSGGVRRIFRQGSMVCLAAGVMCAVFSLPNAAVAQDVGLRRGEASLAAGQFDEAASQLSATVNDKNATINQVAQALYLRGIAYRRAGYPGQAVADLGAALWLGLPSSDKARAYVNKGLAFQAAGMESQGSSAMAQARRYSNSSTVQKLIAQDGGVGPVASAGLSSYVPSAGNVWDKIVPSFGTPKAAESSESAAAPAAQSASSSSAAATPQAAPTSGWNASVNEGSGGNAVSRWWNSVAGGSAESAPEPTPANPATASSGQSRSASNTTTATRSAAPAPPADTSSGDSGIGGWFSRQTAALTGGSSAPAASAGSGYTVQLANSRSKSEAEALWAKAKQSNGSLSSAPSRVERVNLGGLGTFYTVKIGPFASQSEGSKICNSIKRGGTDCTVISPGG